MSWTSTALSGWCAMDLHGHADGRIEHGYCRLDETKCGCPCHVGGKVARRRTAWVGPTDTVDTEDLADESDDDD